MLGLQMYVNVCVCGWGGGTFVPTYTQTPLAKMEHIIMTMSTKCSLAEPDLDCYRQEWLLRSGRLGEATTPKLCIAASNKVAWLLEVMSG